MSGAGVDLAGSPHTHTFSASASLAVALTSATTASFSVVGNHDTAQLANPDLGRKTIYGDATRKMIETTVYGFPPELYRCQYPATGEPALAARVQALLAPDTVHALEGEWGLDHGCWQVLMFMYPQADVPVQVRARARVMLSTRKRLVGGFYAYDNRVDIKDLGTLCEGRSDARGLLLCEAALKQAGEVELIVSARDAQGRMSEAAQSVWITREGELWFGGDNHDRIDVMTPAPAEQGRVVLEEGLRRAAVLVARTMRVGSGSIQGPFGAVVPGPEHPRLNRGNGLICGWCPGVCVCGRL